MIVIFVRLVRDTHRGTFDVPKEPNQRLGGLGERVYLQVQNHMVDSILR